MKSVLAAFALVAVASGLAAAGPACSVEVVDKLNRTSEVFLIDSKTAGSSSALYSVTDGRLDKETALVSGPKTPIDTHDGVPHLSPDEILKAYGAGADAVLASKDGKAEVRPLTLRIVSGSCDRFKVSLLLFWINEWFYFG